MTREHNPKLTRRGIWTEYMYFLRNHRMWWLLPVFAIITVMGVLVVFAGSKGALLIYALF